MPIPKRPEPRLPFILSLLKPALRLAEVDAGWMVAWFTSALLSAGDKLTTNGLYSFRIGSNRKKDSTMVKKTFSLAAALATLSLSVTIYGQQEDYRQWANHQDIVINTSASGYDIGEDLYNFPYLVRLSSAAFQFGQALPDGRDIRFVNASGQPLSCQIELWDTVTQKAAVWVKVDHIRGNTPDQSIRMYWGKADAADRSNGPAVFDTADGFVGVWHLNEAGNSDFGGYLDATGNHYDGTGTAMTEMGSAARALADIGYGQLMMGAQYITLPAPYLNSNSVTMSLWVNLPAPPADWAAPFFCRGGTTKALGMSLRQDGGFSYHWMDNYYNWSSGLNVPTGKPVFLVLSVSGTAATLYSCSDGQLHAAINTAAHDPAAFDADMLIGADSYGGRFVSGTVDEVVLSKVTRSADWIKLAYLNQRYTASGAAVIRYPEREYLLAVSDIVSLTPTLSEVVDSVTVNPELPYALTLNKANGTIEGWLDDTCTLTMYHFTTYNSGGSYMDSVAIGTQKPVSALDHQAGRAQSGPQLLGIERGAHPRLRYFLPASGAIQSVRFTLYDLKGDALWTATIAGNRLQTGIQALALDNRSLQAKLSAGVYVVEMRMLQKGSTVPGIQKKTLTMLPQ